MAFKPNHEGIGEMLRSPEMQAEMLRRAEKGKAFAESIAPFDPNSKDGTHYKDAFKVSSGVQHHTTSRAYGRLENTDEAALWIEVGTSDTEAHHVLTRAADIMRS